MNPLESFNLWKIPNILTGLACYGVRLAIILFTIVVVYSGIKFLLSRGNPTEFNLSRKIFFTVLLGGLVVFGVYTIILTLGSYIGYTDLPYLPLSCGGSPSSTTQSVDPIDFPRASFGTSEMGISPQSFSLLNSSSVTSSTIPTEGTKLPITDILGAPSDSGWVYIANTVPDANGIMFWGSITKIMNNTGLLYGITDTQNDTYYSGFLTGGTINVSDTGQYSVSYSSGANIIFEARQASQFSSDLVLSVNLPWPSSSNSQRAYQLNQNFSMIGQPIFESGDGVVPMGSGLNSWYVSFAFNQGLWMDVQKFNLSRNSAFGRGSINHRWGSFIINQNNSSLPIGTRGVWWEIIDGSNRLTNFDLIGNNLSQQTRSNFEFLPIQLWNSGNKTYSTKYRISQQSLGIDITAETVTNNQENFVGGKYFYEGMTKIFDTSTGQLIGTGMHEQTLSD